MANYSAKDFFNARGESYIRNASWVKNEYLNDLVIKIVGDINPSSIVDLGSGDGQLLKLVYWVKRKIAIDISQFMLNKIKDLNVEKIIGDIHCIPLTDSVVDMITCRQVLHYSDMGVVFNEMYRILKNEGSVLIIQITDNELVPVEWYNFLKSFKQIQNRKHVSQIDIINAASLAQFNLIEKHEFQFRMNHEWINFFEKNGIEDETNKEVVFNFFKNTNDFIKRQIDLNLSKQGISYNRVFSYLLFKKTSEITL